MIAQVRSVMRTDPTSDEWFLLEGVSQDDVLSQVRMRAVIAVGSAVLHAIKTGADKKTAMTYLFDADGCVMLGVEIKWADNEEPIRHSVTVNKADMVGDMMAYLLTSGGGQR